MASRECSICKQVKPLSAFTFKGRQRNGKQRYAYCRPCQSAYQRASKYARIFNISIEEYDAMLADQGGVCAICERPPKNMRLAVDHRHKDGLVRGLLCSACNRALAGFREDPERFRAAAIYLEKPPAWQTIGDRYGRPGRTDKRKRKHKLK